MTVNISEVSGNKDLMLISVLGEEWRYVHKSFYRKYLRDIRRCKSTQELTELFSEIEPLVTKAYVYKLLGTRGYFEKELREKLEKRGVARPVIDQVLGECRNRCYLDDQREAKLFIKRGQRKGWGPALIRQKLKMKGGEVLGEMEESFSSDKQREMVAALIAKKYRKENCSDPKVKQKIYRFLRTKGFEDFIIREFLFDD